MVLLGTVVAVALWVVLQTHSNFPRFLPIFPNFLE
jgi:hypothetical protein